MRSFSAVSAAAVVVLTAAVTTLVSASPLAAVGQEHQQHQQLAPIHIPNNPWASDGGEEGEEGGSSKMGTQSVQSNLIPDQYIVVLKENMAHSLPFHLDHLRAYLAQASLRGSGHGHGNDKRSLLGDVVESIAHRFDVGEMKGYAGRFSQQTLEWIRRSPAVAFVEQDSIVRAMDIERGAPWGLARISHRKALSLSTL